MVLYGQGDELSPIIVQIVQSVPIRHLPSNEFLSIPKKKGRKQTLSNPFIPKKYYFTPSSIFM
jgi:hypothetical protein